jgi:hypothetical protein
MNILQAINDRNLFAGWLKDKETWDTWLVVLKAIFALEMNQAEQTTFKKFTARDRPPQEAVKEAWLVCGRRGGKSFVLALLGEFIAAFHEYRTYLQPGERATVLIVAHDQRQARVIFRFIQGFLNFIPMLRDMVERETANSFDLKNQTSIEISTASYRSVRGYAIIAFLADEIAFWPAEDSADPDVEILRAVRPAMAQFPNALLLAASSPYARKGALYDAYQRHFGKDRDDILVWQADTRSMNPTVPQSFLDAEYEKDPLSAAAEYGAQFRTDVESYISREAIEACTVPLVERAPHQGIKYYGFVDPSGGSADSMTMAISHMDHHGRAILDLVREVVPPFKPSEVAGEFAQTFRRFGCWKILGDRYAGEWPREQFRIHNVSYDAAADSKSNLYRDLLPLLNSGQVELLNHKRLQLQLMGLERRTTRAGRDAIDHPPGGHDDLANCVAGALLMCLASKKREVHSFVIAGYGAGKLVPLDKGPKVRSWQRRVLTAEEARAKREAFAGRPVKGVLH